MDIGKIIHGQKELFLKRGTIPPVLWVELVREGEVRYPFGNFPFCETKERQQAFFYVGQVVAQQYPGDEIRQLCFLMEVWFGANPTRKPSQDPRRREGLSVFILDVDGFHLSQSGKLFEIIHAGATVDLVERREPFLHEDILPFFVMGFTEVQKSIKK